MASVLILRVAQSLLVLFSLVPFYASSSQVKTITVPIAKIDGPVDKAGTAGKWVAVPNPMQQARFFHTATRLGCDKEVTGCKGGSWDGKVLIVGGEGAFSSGSNPPVVTLHSTNTAELYDPISQVWTAAGSLTAPREQHTSTLLPNGKVLVVGGKNIDSTQTATLLNSAELYDPSTGLWTSAGTMQHARYGHTATLISSNGKVLVLVVGGTEQSGTYSRDTELYDYTSNSWSTTGLLHLERRSHTATVLSDGRVLVVGGFSQSGYTYTGEIYDPTLGTWQNTANSHWAHDSQVAILLNSGVNSGKVLVAAGYNFYEGGYVSSAEIYDPIHNTWTDATSLPFGCYGIAVTDLANNKGWLMTGGIIADGQPPTPQTLVYNYSTGAWDQKGDLNTARYFHTATILKDNAVLVTGGLSSNKALGSAESYDPGLPIITVSPVSLDPLKATATLNILVNDNGAAGDTNADTTVTFDYGLTTSYSSTNNPATTPITTNPTDPTIVAGSGDTKVTFVMSGLSCNTSYHYLVRAKNGVGTRVSADQSFTTNKCAPIVTTSDADSITPNSATIHGSVADNGNTVNVSFELMMLPAKYGFNVVADPSQVPVSPASNVTTAVKAVLNDLICQATYQYRIKALVVGSYTPVYDNGVGVKTFTTGTCDSKAPSITNAPAVNVSTTGALLVGTVNPNGIDTTVSFNYGKDTGYGQNVVAPQSPISAYGGITAVNAILSGLDIGTTYHYQLIAANTKGTTNGADQSFTTLGPSLVTGPASKVSTTGATLNGMVNANGVTVSSIAFEYGPDTKYGTIAESNPKTVDKGASSTPVAAVLSGLTANTVYHYRIKATYGDLPTTSNGFGIDSSFKASAPGDADGNGKFDPADMASIVAQIKSGVADPSTGNADCNNDGKINSLDLICIASMILGI